MKDIAKRKFFDRKASGWYQRNHTDEKSRIQKLINRFSLKPKDLVLDVGTGNGVLLPYLSTKVKLGGKILALDFSWRMISEAKKNNRKKNIGFLNASAEALPIKDRKLDCITCFSTFAHICEKKESLTEMARILKKGGRLYIAHPFGKKELAFHHKSAGGVVEHDTLPSDPVMKNMMRRCGFKEVQLIDQPDLYLASAKK